MTTQAEPDHPRPIIVLGAPRSGTSLMGQVVHRWGAGAGEPERLVKGNEGNPLGYWEYSPLVQFQLRLLDSVRVSPFHEQFDAILDARARDGRWTQEARELVEHMNRRESIWFWKVPQYVLLLRFWKEIIPDPVYVVTVRNPFDTALSNEEHFMPRDVHSEVTVLHGMLQLWQHYMVAILELTEQSTDRIFVAYEKLVENPQDECDRLGGFLDERYSTTGERRDAMTECSTRTLWRNQSEVPLDQNPLVTESQRTLYEALLRKTSDHTEQLDPSMFRVEPAMQESLNTMFVFYRYLLRFKTQQRTLNARSVRYCLAVTRLLRKLMGRGRR